jgi:hypothetical protein
VRAGPDDGEGLSVAGQQGRLGEQRREHGDLALVEAHGLAGDLLQALGHHALASLGG